MKLCTLLITLFLVAAPAFADEYANCDAQVYETIGNKTFVVNPGLVLYNQNGLIAGRVPFVLRGLPEATYESAICRVCKFGESGHSAKFHVIGFDSPVARTSPAGVIEAVEMSFEWENTLTSLVCEK